MRKKRHAIVCMFLGLEDAHEGVQDIGQSCKVELRQEKLV